MKCDMIQYNTTKTIIKVALTQETLKATNERMNEERVMDGYLKGVWGWIT